MAPRAPKRSVLVLVVLALAAASVASVVSRGTDVVVDSPIDPVRRHTGPTTTASSGGASLRRASLTHVDRVEIGDSVLVQGAAVTPIPADTRHAVGSPALVGSLADPIAATALPLPQPPPPQRPATAPAVLPVMEAVLPRTPVSPASVPRRGPAPAHPQASLAQAAPSTQAPHTAQPPRALTAASLKARWRRELFSDATTEPLSDGYIRPFFLIGCMKCGSTTFHSELLMSPHVTACRNPKVGAQRRANRGAGAAATAAGRGVQLGAIKEAMLVRSNGLFTQRMYRTTEAEGLAQHPHSDTPFLTLDAYPVYLAQVHAPGHFATALGAEFARTKLLAIVRHPVQRLFSHYWNINLLKEHKARPQGPFPEFAETVAADLAELNACVADRRAVHELSPTPYRASGALGECVHRSRSVAAMSNYLYFGLFGEQLRLWLCGLQAHWGVHGGGRGGNGTEGARIDGDALTGASTAATADSKALLEACPTWDDPDAPRLLDGALSPARQNALFVTSLEELRADRAATVDAALVHAGLPPLLGTSAESEAAAAAAASGAEGGGPDSVTATGGRARVLRARGERAGQRGERARARAAAAARGQALAMGHSRADRGGAAGDGGGTGAEADPAAPQHRNGATPGYEALLRQELPPELLREVTQLYEADAANVYRLLGRRLPWTFGV